MRSHLWTFFWFRSASSLSSPFKPFPKGKAPKTLKHKKIWVSWVFPKEKEPFMIIADSPLICRWPTTGSFVGCKSGLKIAGNRYAILSTNTTTSSSGSNNNSTNKYNGDNLTQWQMRHVGLPKVMLSRDEEVANPITDLPPEKPGLGHCSVFTYVCMKVRILRWWAGWSVGRLVEWKITRWRARRSIRL